MMRRILCLLFTLALLLGLAACGGAGEGEGPSGSGGWEIPSGPEASRTEQPPSSQGPWKPGPASPADGETREPEREPIGSPAAALAPETLPEELFTSSLFQEALSRPSVIVYENKAVTDPQPVRDFLAAAQRGEDWDLYCWDFSAIYGYNITEGSPYLVLRHFSSDGGKISLTTSYAESWEVIDEDGDRYRVTDLALGKHGYLTFHDTGVRVVNGVEEGQPTLSSRDGCFPVINERDLEGAEERQDLFMTYLEPIRPSGAWGFGSWSSPGEASRLLFLFEDIYHSENGYTIWGEYADGNIPVKDIVDTLSRYFENVTAQDVISSWSSYNAGTDTIYYEGGRGGGPLPLAFITGWTRDGETLLIDYESYDGETMLFTGEYRVTLKLREDGTFRYISNLKL